MRICDLGDWRRGIRIPPRVRYRSHYVAGPHDLGLVLMAEGKLDAASVEMQSESSGGGRFSGLAAILPSSGSSERAYVQKECPLALTIGDPLLSSSPAILVLALSCAR
jgi:hypothetical protein